MSSRFAWRAATLALVIAGAVMAPAAAALAAQPDYQGTYVGVGTSSSGKSIPITVILRDDGDTVSMILASGGYSVKATSPEVWAGNALKLTPTIDAGYLKILSGTGEATLVLKDKKWTGTGSGTGTLLATKSGSGKGSVQLLTRAFDLQRAEEWHLANPIPESAAPAKKTNPAVVVAVAGVANPVAPDSQLPISDPEKLLSCSAAGLFLALLFIWQLITFQTVNVYSEIEMLLAHGEGSSDSGSEGGE